MLVWFSTDMLKLMELVLAFIVFMFIVSEFKVDLFKFNFTEFDVECTMAFSNPFEYWRSWLLVFGG